MANCIAAYKMNDNAASTTVVDSRGLSNGTAQQNTSVLHTTGKVGGALTFNGSSDYVAITSPSQIDITAAPLSVFAWVYPAVSAVSGYVVCKNLSASSNIQYALYWNGTNFYVTCYLEGEIKTTSANGSVLAGQWSFVGFTWDGTSVKCFVDGSQSGNTGSYTGSLTSRAYCNIGRRETAATYFTGSLDNVMIFNKTLSAIEIAFLYNDGYGTEELPEEIAQEDELAQMWAW
jgi:hypothetical protein